jgi:hypothetical protein
MNTTYSVNLAQCLRPSNGWGQTTWYNVCDNTQHVVPWGSMDYVGPIIASGFLLAITAMVVACVVELFRAPKVIIA